MNGPAVVGARASGQPKKNIRRSRSGANRADAGTTSLAARRSRTGRRDAHDEREAGHGSTDAAAASSSPIVLRFVDIAVDALAGAREEIDALNVYPVPDGDTGTNMYLTMSAARDADPRGRGRRPADLRRRAAPRSRRGALLGARGNSGVILSQMLGALARRIAEASPDERNARGDGRGAGRRRPRRATPPSVRRSRARSSRSPGPPPTPPYDAPAEPRRAGSATSFTRPRPPRPARRWPAPPSSCQVLRDAGVVDAGGRGLCVVLDAAETALTGRRPIAGAAALGVPHRSRPLTAAGRRPDRRTARPTR